MILHIWPLGRSRLYIGYLKNNKTMSWSRTEQACNRLPMTSWMQVRWYFRSPDARSTHKMVVARARFARGSSRDRLHLMYVRIRCGKCSSGWTGFASSDTFSAVQNYWWFNGDFTQIKYRLNVKILHVITQNITCTRTHVSASKYFIFILQNVGNWYHPYMELIDRMLPYYRFMFNSIKI